MDKIPAVFYKKHTVHGEKSQKWQEWRFATCGSPGRCSFCPGLIARPPIREAILKKCIHITWIELPGRWQKHTVRCVLFKKKLPGKEEGYPGRTPLGMHRPRIPASFVIPGSLPWVSRLLPGFRRLPADLHRHHEPVSSTTTEIMPFFSFVLPFHGWYACISPFSPEHAISLPFPDYWPGKPGNWSHSPLHSGLSFLRHTPWCVYVA